MGRPKWGCTHGIPVATRTKQQRIVDIEWRARKRREMERQAENRACLQRLERRREAIREILAAT